jgi:hypothetical protein
MLQIVCVGFSTIWLASTSVWVGIIFPCRPRVAKAALPLLAFGWKLEAHNTGEPLAGRNRADALS